MMSIETCKFDGQSRLGKKSRRTDRLSLEAGNSFSKKWSGGKKGLGWCSGHTSWSSLECRGSSGWGGKDVVWALGRGLGR